MKKLLKGLLVVLCLLPSMTIQAAEPANFYVEWPRVEQAVAYEVEVVDGAQLLAAKKGAVVPAIWRNNYIYTTGCNVQLPATFKGRSVNWRVRGLDYYRQPLSAYTPWRKVAIDQSLPVVRKPLSLQKIQTGNGAALLYPVYYWIPLQGIRDYEVEILSAPPENPNGTTASQYRLTTKKGSYFDLYDDTPRSSFVPMYWRVRAVDEKGQTLGVYSDAAAFSANPGKNYQVGVLGDSISHGGGSISYPPANLDYSYLHYLNFDAVNLSASGDTSAATLARFDEDVLPFHPRYLLIMTGSNSLRGWVKADSVIGDLQAIKAKCLDHNIKPVFLTLPPINPANIKRAFDEPTAEDWQEQFAAVNAYIKTQVYIDTAAGLADADGNLPTALGLDGIHLDPSGKKKMAAAINAAWPQILQLPASAWQS